VQSRLPGASRAGAWSIRERVAPTHQLILLAARTPKLYRPWRASRCGTGPGVARRAPSSPRGRTTVSLPRRPCSGHRLTVPRAAAIAERMRQFCLRALEALQERRRAAPAVVVCRAGQANMGAGRSTWPGNDGPSRQPGAGGDRTRLARTGETVSPSTPCDGGRPVWSRARAARGGRPSSRIVSGSETSRRSCGPDSDPTRARRVTSARPLR
jgi:hypothetical protein